MNSYTEMYIDIRIRGKKSLEGNILYIKIEYIMFVIEAHKGKGDLQRKRYGIVVSLCVLLLSSSFVMLQTRAIWRELCRRSLQPNLWGWRALIGTLQPLHVGTKNSKRCWFTWQNGQQMAQLAPIERRLRGH